MAKARFHLPGLRNNYPLNMLWINFIRQYPQYFRDVEIGSVFGEFPMSLWNGGRFSNHDQCDEKYIRSVVKNMNAAGVPVRYTYTNPLITEDDLDDPYCNFCMKVADNGMNEVMIFSPILEKYLREKYPSFVFNSSTCKEIKDIDTLNAEIDSDAYKYVVLDYNLNNQWDFLEKVNHPEKLEVLVNTLCVPNCTRRGAHYENISKNQRIALKNRTLPPDKQIPIIPWHCEYGDKNCIHNIQDYPTVIKPDDIWEKYVPMGITNFKIEGRTANLFSLIDTYCLYMMKPEYVGEGRLLLINNLTHMGIINVSKPRPSHWP